MQRIGHALAAKQLSAGFGQVGATVTVVADGKAGITHAEATPPTLILLAIELDGMNGFLVCKKIKKDPALAEIPMVILSSDANADEIFEQHKKLRTRAEEYLHKPYSIELLLSKIDPLVGLDVQAADSPIETIDDAAIEEISVDDAVIEEELPEAPAGHGAAVKGKPEAMDDVEIDQETDAAFAAIGFRGIDNHHVSSITDVLRIFERDYNQVDVSLRPRDGGWQIGLNTREAVGDVFWRSAGEGWVEGNFKRLAIRPAAEAGAIRAGWPSLNAPWITLLRRSTGRPRSARLTLIIPSAPRSSPRYGPCSMASAAPKRRSPPTRRQRRGWPSVFF